MKNYLLILLIIIGSTGCTTKEKYILFNQTEINNKNKQLEEETITQLESVEFEYKIQTHDRVSVIIYKHPDLSTANLTSMQQDRGLLVNSKGMIRLPLIKSIHVAGLTQSEAENALEKAMSVYLKNPDIQVEVLNKRAYIIGEVKNPGEIELQNERLTLLQLIAKAGDLTDSANRQSIIIFKEGPSSKLRSRVVNLTDVHSLKTANLMIYPNDIVYVTPNNMKAFNTGVKEVDPIFNLIGHVLAPFVSIKFLSR
jgi:polysaccharide export outer membrane protein